MKVGQEECKRNGRLQRERLVVALAMMFVVLMLTHIPQEHMPIDLTWFSLDKLIHVYIYAGLGILFLSAFHAPRPPLVTWSIFSYLLIMATLDEWSQELVGRSCSLWDFQADCAGIGLAVALEKLKLFLTNKRKHSVISEEPIVSKEQ